MEESARPTELLCLGSTGLIGFGPFKDIVSTSPEFVDLASKARSSRFIKTVVLVLELDRPSLNARFAAIAKLKSVHTRTGEGEGRPVEFREAAANSWHQVAARFAGRVIDKLFPMLRVTEAAGIKLVSDERVTLEAVQHWFTDIRPHLKPFLTQTNDLELLYARIDAEHQSLKTAGEIPLLDLIEAKNTACWLARYFATCDGWMSIDVASDQTIPKSKAPPPATEPDGPVGPDGFTFNGVACRGLQPKPFRMLSFLWEKQNRVASLDDLAEFVLEDPESHYEDEPHGWTKRLNIFFRKQSIPFHATIKNKQAAILDGEPQPSRKTANAKKGKKPTKRP